MENKKKTLNWKDTLLIGKTSFSMKAQLNQKEPLYRKKWLENNIYQKVLEKNKRLNKGKFILHDGPPYANGNLHVGHALNKILKDIIVRRKNLEGIYSPFVPGWDTHGLPIENKMLADLKMNKDDLEPIILRKKAESYALKQVKIQEEQFLKMQLFSDFKEKYLTLNKDYEVGQLKLFKKMALNKMIYKGLKPIYWSPSSQSALAEAEVEYQDIRSPEIIVAFKIIVPSEIVPENTFLLIMTTTPWTLIANAAVAVSKNFDYLLVKNNNQNFVVVKEKFEELKERCKWEEVQIIKEIKGSKLIGLEYQRPILKTKKAKVVEGHHVSKETGTGLVHIAPLFGEDDYLIGKKENLEMIMHVDDKGHLNEQADEYKGLFYEKANKEIGIFLEKQKLLLSLKFVKHSYPHDWRTHKPVIYRGVPQWFVNISKIKNQIFRELDKIESYPKWGITKIKKMIENRQEWNISRQRTWGVPIIIFYDENQNPQYNEELFDHVIDLVAKNGTNIWWEKTTDQLLPSKFQNRNWTREMDIMDVWFDSGSSSIAVQVNGEKAPFDLYLEGSDQYRGWFNSSLINAIAYYGKAPFKKLVSHGFALDGKQEKMSKSKGNVVDPLDFIAKNGAEILRLWVANSEYSSDVSISDEITKQNIEIYRRIRNTFKFMLSNINDFNFTKNHVKVEDIHKYISNEINNYEVKANNAYEEYRFIDVIKLTNNLFIKLSSWYFDYGKDILYCQNSNDKERRMIQTNIFKTINVTMKILAPILPTTIEEIYENFEIYKEKKPSFFLEEHTFNFKNIKQENKYIKFDTEYRSKANKLLEQARKDNLIKRNNEAILKVNIDTNDLIGQEKDYAKYFMVSKVIFANEWNVNKNEDFQKCQRCWNYFALEEITKKLICLRCSKVIS